MLWFFRGTVNSSITLCNIQTEAYATDSQEFQGSVTLDTRNQTLVEKMLEFLYTGDYTIEDNTIETRTLPSDSDKIPESDTRHSEEALRLSQKDQDDMENLLAENNAVDKTAVSLSNRLTASLMDQCSADEKTIAGEGPLTGSSEQMDAIEET
ncbi:unnamed protein product [Penicillium salamii]|nr:unnamed protein product [Penicillium salamii]